MKRLLAVFLLAALAGVVSADQVNYDPMATPPAPVLDAGWAYDQINQAFVDSLDSPYLYNLAAPAIFRITDDFVTGDVYYVRDSGVLILTTTFYSGSATGPDDPSGWFSSSYSKGEILLGAGAHSLTVQGDGAGGVPAGFYTKLSSAPAVPVPGALVLGAIGTGLVQWLRKRRAV